jgi:DNA-binding NarL/FixJ family response regulator
MDSLPVENSGDPDLDQIESSKWQLTKLKPMHKQVASLCAQGLKNVEIARIVGITPEYVSMLLRQPLVKAHVMEMCDVVGTRLEALFEKSVDVIAETLESGSEKGRLAAARLQLEATKRIGRPDPNAGLDRGQTDRLANLAERLLSLQSNVRQGKTFNENGQEITDA